METFAFERRNTAVAVVIAVGQEHQEVSYLLVSHKDKNVTGDQFFLQLCIHYQSHWLTASLLKSLKKRKSF